MRTSVIAVPGGVNPAAPRYAPVAAAFGDRVELHLKDLEVYSGDQPPAGYSIDLEVHALARFADSLGLDRFHLLAYSAGGFISLAFAGRYPRRLLSLAIFEPAGVPGQRTPEEADRARRLDEALDGLEGGDYMRTFMQMQVAPGTVLAPPAGPPPPWMRTRPAGLTALMSAFAAHPFDRVSLRSCGFPVFVGHGDLSGEQEELKVGILARLLPDLHVRRFAGIHHFVSPQELYTPEHLAAIADVWRAGEREAVTD